MTTRRSTDRRHGGRLTALLLLGALALAACGGEDSGIDEATMEADLAGRDSAMDGAQEPAPEQLEEAASAPDIAPVPPPAGGPAPAGMDRAVIRTGTMHIRATDTAEVADEVVEVVEDADGYVAGTDLSRNAEGVVQGSFTFRVPTGVLTEVLDAFDGLADAVLERRLDETDVTTQLVDLEAEITNLEAFERELRELLTEVRERDADTEAEDLLAVFDRINSVRGQIDQAQARRAMLTDQVAMSTIYLQLSPTASTGPVTDPGWDPGGTTRSALAATVRALTSLADAAIRIGLTILPITLVLLAPVALLVWLLRRWWKRRPRTETTPAPAPAWSAPMPPPPGSEPTAGGQQPGPPAVAPPSGDQPDDRSEDRSDDARPTG